MHDFFHRLPPFLGKEIFSYLIPKDVIFINHRCLSSEDRHGYKYQNAVIGGQYYKNEQGLSLSRIWKEKGKHRYYLTQHFTDEATIEYFDRNIVIYCYDYSSIYIGKNLESALLQLLYNA
uniref:Uncharacterized protein n=1 Tax=viral metagenome TaxID=1070528 RepID=A0A6C0HVP6_9ZZZZ